jgi:hypothetical protein
MASFAENFGLLGMYTRQLPWDDLRGAGLTDSGERPYTLSKTYILMAARELARRLEGSGVDVLTGGKQGGECAMRSGTRRYNHELMYCVWWLPLGYVAEC